MVRTRLLRSSSFLPVLTALSVAGCGPTSSTEKPKEAPRVTVAHPVVRELVDEDDYTGWMQAAETVEVRARVRGHIAKIHFQDGDLVKKDQLLFELDPRPFEVAIKEATAKARALDAQKVAADKDTARNRELVKKGAVSQQDFEKVEADALSYDARIAATMQEVERFKLDLEFARITAPISGRIGRAQLTEGNLVNAGGSDPLLTTIVSVDPIYVYFSIDERALQQYQKSGASRRGEKEPISLREQKIPFAFGLDTEQGYPHQGLLDFADNKVIEGTGTIEVRGVAENKERLFVPGSRVRVRIPVSEKYPAAVVPDTALLADQDRRYLLVLGQDNTALRRDVTPGRLLDDGMRVLLPAPGEEKAAGNQDWAKHWEQEWVITVGLQRARVNHPVQPLDSNGQPIATTGAAQ
jgi:RND family efflux transporter MFP subunit